jgi:chemotaxis protein histidine kinase CheA
LIVRNYHLEEPAQTIFTLNHVTMDIEPKDVGEANLPPFGLVLPVAEPGAAPVALPQQPENEFVALQQELLKIKQQAAAGEAELKQELLRIQHAQQVEDLKAQIQTQKSAAEQADLERQRQIAAAQAVLAQQQQAAAEQAVALEQARQAAEAAKQQAEDAARQSAAQVAETQRRIAEDAARQQAAAQQQAQQRLEETAQRLLATASQTLQVWHNSLSNHERRGDEKTFNKKHYGFYEKDHDLAKRAWKDPNNALINQAVNDPVLYGKLWSKADRFPTLSGNGSLMERLQAAKLAQIKATLS